MSLKSAILHKYYGHLIEEYKDEGIVNIYQIQDIPFPSESTENQFIGTIGDLIRTVTDLETARRFIKSRGRTGGKAPF